MIDASLLHLNFIKKEPQSGSDLGMRYMLSKGENEDGVCLDAVIWPEPFCYAKTPEEKKIRKQFPLTGDGLEEARNWMNEQHKLYENPAKA